MHVLRVITKRSIRDLPENRFKFFYHDNHIEPGSFIEIVDASRKSPALVIESDTLAPYKQAIRDKTISPEKIIFSKTGPYAHGTVMEALDTSLLAKYLVEPSNAVFDSSKLVRSFFPKTLKKKSKKPEPKPASTDGTMAGLSLDRYADMHKSAKNGPSTELQAYVDQVRTYFSERAKFGQGSFSYYLGFCKKIPMRTLWQIFGEVKQSRKIRRDQHKLFWWKIGQQVRKNDSNLKDEDAANSITEQKKSSANKRIIPRKEDLPF